MFNHLVSAPLDHDVFRVVPLSWVMIRPCAAASMEPTASGDAGGAGAAGAGYPPSEVLCEITLGVSDSRPAPIPTSALSQIESLHPTLPMTLKDTLWASGPWTACTPARSLVSLSRTDPKPCTLNIRQSRLIVHTKHLRVVLMVLLPLVAHAVICTGSVGAVKHRDPGLDIDHYPPRLPSPLHKQWYGVKLPEPTAALESVLVPRPGSMDAQLYLSTSGYRRRTCPVFIDAPASSAAAPGPETRTCCPCCNEWVVSTLNASLRAQKAAACANAVEADAAADPDLMDSVADDSNETFMFKVPVQMFEAFRVRIAGIQKKLTTAKVPVHTCLLKRYCVVRE